MLLLLVSAAQAHTTVSLLLVSAAQAHTTVRLHVPCTPILRHARTVLAAPAVTYDGVSESMQQGERLLDAIRAATHARKQARPPILRRCAAEFAATGLIFFVGNALTALLATGAIASALTWGVVVAAAVASTVNLSGAHFNPSVTIAFAAGGKHPWAETPCVENPRVCSSTLPRLVGARSRPCQEPIIRLRHCFLEQQLGVRMFL